MKIISTLVCFVLLSLFANAQFKPIAQGPVFEEPESGFAKIIQLKNGNTVFLHITNKDGIDVKVYDAAHKSIADQHIEPAYGKLKGGSVEAAFEINGDAVLLISEVDDRTPVLYRLIIDGSKGILKEEKQVASLNKVKMMQGYAMLFGGVPVPDFFVRKDPNSENYALALMNSFEGDRNKRIEIVFFGGDHKEIGRAFYASPNDKYKYLEYIDMAVMGNKKVSVLANAYNTASSGGKERELVIANLEAGAKEVTLDELNFTKNMLITNGITRYNPVTQKLLLLAAAKETRKSKEYSSFIIYIDPFQRRLEKTEDVYPTKANDESLRVFGKKSKYTGMPQNLFINNDGSFSVVYEDITAVVQTTSSGASYTYSILGNIAVSTFDKEGKVIADYFIPKEHKLMGTYLRPFYLSDREGTAQLLDKGNQFKSFAYLSGTNKNYILFNDIARNAETVKDGKLTTILGVSDCDGFYFDASGTNTMPERQFVFGAADSKRDHNLALFSISDYNKETNVYVTLKLEKEGRSKGVSVVWLQP